MLMEEAARPHFPTTKPKRTPSLDEEIGFIERLVSKGGPSPDGYPALDDWFQRVENSTTSEKFSPADRLRLFEAFGEAMSPETLQGLGYHRPHGYAGDFEVIDKIYVRHHSPNPRLIRWDAYFHSQPPSRAVRNRKIYFHNLLDQHYVRRRPLRVLKLASGSGRCMFEWLSAHPNADVSFSCVELDPDAIMYASALNQEFASKVSFEHKNVIRYRPPIQFDLIWAAGLFDYFSDKVFQSVVRRLLPAVADQGELVIGNFAPRGRHPYMEFGGWTLHYRSAQELVALARGCGVEADAIHIGAEPEAVNLFLHIKSQ
jgi:extracellular factor (EF) 3-hydroxypalmitic acid methyl ester biosynthesis protein